jgi:hypothetical protein
MQTQYMKIHILDDFLQIHFQNIEKNCDYLEDKFIQHFVNTFYFVLNIHLYLYFPIFKSNRVKCVIQEVL